MGSGVLVMVTVTGTAVIGISCAASVGGTKNVGVEEGAQALRANRMVKKKVSRTGPYETISIHIPNYSRGAEDYSAP